MDRIISGILEWPVIVQGALGSGLFWIILYCGQKLVTLVSEKFSKISRQSKISALREDTIKYQITLPENSDRSAQIAILLYLALRRITKGLIWMTLGFSFQSVIPVFGLVGYLGALYYLFIALRTFRPIDAGVDKGKRIEELKSEIAELEGRNKEIQPTADAAAD